MDISDPVSGALKTVRLLRAQVCDLFTTLAQGVPTDGQIYPPHQTAGTATGATQSATIIGTPNGEQTATGPTGQQQSQQQNGHDRDSQAEALKNWLTAFTQATALINIRVRDLDSHTTLIGSHQGNSVLVGSTSHLALDPSQDKSGLYVDLLKAHRWQDKFTDYSRMCETLLRQQFPKRSLGPNLHQKRSPLLKLRLASSGFNANPNQVDGYLGQFSRMYAQDMKVDCLRPFGSASIVVIIVSRVCRAFLVLRGFIIEHVVIRGLSEQVYTDENAKESGPGGSAYLSINKTLQHTRALDMWTDSRYHVFRRITDLAVAQSLPSPHISLEMSLRSFFMWLHSFMNLFTAPCRKCGLRLKNGLPPLEREYRTNFAPFHDVCKS